MPGFEAYERDGMLYLPDDIDADVSDTPRGDDIEREFHHAERIAQEADPIAEMRSNIIAALNASRRQYGEDVHQESDLWDNDDREAVEA